MKKEIVALYDEVLKIRRELHQIPEVEFDLEKTHAVLKHYLTEFGYETETTAKIGLVAMKKGRSDKSIAFRSDMDALNVFEKTDVPFTSKTLGKMHACGHDGHMAILLGFAKYVANLEPEKNIVFIFQPAEEGPGGAQLVIQDGIFNKYHIESIFGLHLFPGLEEGTIGLANGPLMAQTGEIDITIHGKSTHGAIPQNGIDAIVVAGQLINAYQSIISRNISPIEGAVLTIGKITGGEARNVIANTVKLEGTIRAFDKEVFSTIKRRMAEVNAGFEKMHGITIDFHTNDSYPALINHPEVFVDVSKALEQEKTEIIKPMMIAEDFSFYLQVVPGFFLMLGTRNNEKGYIHPLHSCYFNFDEKVLLDGINAYVRICEHLGVL